MLDINGRMNCNIYYVKEEFQDREDDKEKMKEEHLKLTERKKDRQVISYHSTGSLSMSDL